MSGQLSFVGDSQAPTTLLARTGAADAAMSAVNTSDAGRNWRSAERKRARAGASLVFKPCFELELSGSLARCMVCPPSLMLTRG
jgi:hypothetical protein